MQRFKTLLAALISHPAIGQLISVVSRNRITRNGANYVLDSKLISARIKALLFWNLYEKAEIRFIQTYLKKDLPVVELGGSLGIVSAIIGKHIGHQDLYTVEANPELVPIIREHLRINKGGQFEVIHAGIGSESELFFTKGNDNTVGRVSNIYAPTSIPVPVKTLRSLLFEKDIQAYSLVSDIEGAELSFLFDDPESLEGCKSLIIELHDSYRNNALIAVDQQIHQLELIGFNIVAKHGPVIFATK